MHLYVGIGVGISYCVVILCFVENQPPTLVVVQRKYHDRQNLRATFNQALPRTF
ncbi:uncharacterized protein BDW43DRAFT_267798 [Aspergillus alliaceus]|uniref:uncharacterized protein n=1 Tax=Petromyces alliaceus TaxID=209559 RepID=UPI0012A5DFCA|nr:uncharacterized protein BDW43DRAFT_267798 [Aspergillus alliaceus]KAB8236198.1 hypothetical protein BDW43DRAFT_267798 [Aspergillus alliaceus]